MSIFTNSVCAQPKGAHRNTEYLWGGGGGGCCG